MIAVLLFLAFFVVAAPLLLRVLAKDLFRVQYITWYLLHWGVAVTAMLLLAVLAMAGLLSSPLIALFASVFGYVLGSNSSRSTTSDSTAAKALAVHKIIPPSAPAGAMIAITGQSFDQGVTVTVGGQPLTDIVVAADGSMLTGLLPARIGAGKVDVVVKNPNDLAQTVSSAIEIA